MRRFVLISGVGLLLLVGGALIALELAGTGRSVDVDGRVRGFGTGSQTVFVEHGEIIHNLATALISSDGKLVWLWRGNDWTPEDILQVAGSTLREKPPGDSNPR